MKNLSIEAGKNGIKLFELSKGPASKIPDVGDFVDSTYTSREEFSTFRSAFTLYHSESFVTESHHGAELLIMRRTLPHIHIVVNPKIAYGDFAFDLFSNRLPILEVEGDDGSLPRGVVELYVERTQLGLRDINFEDDTECRHQVRFVLESIQLAYQCN